MTDLTALRPPDLGDCLARLNEGKSVLKTVAERALFGFLVSEFSNEELKLMADSCLSIAEVAMLRKVGLLEPDEGYDVKKAMRRTE